MSQEPRRYIIGDHVFMYFSIFMLENILYRNFTWSRYVTEWTFAPSFLSFLESNFALLWYKTLHSEVVWTKENAGKSELRLFADWLITLHKVLWCQNTIKISINKHAKQRQFLGKGIYFLVFTWSRSHDHTKDQPYHLQNKISLFYSSLRLNATCDSRQTQFARNYDSFFQFSSGAWGPMIQTTLAISCEFDPRIVK